MYLPVVVPGGVVGGGRRREGGRERKRDTLLGNNVHKRIVWANALWAEVTEVKADVAHPF